MQNSYYYIITKTETVNTGDGSRSATSSAAVCARP
jgi:hypothetical protein